MIGSLETIKQEILEQIPSLIENDAAFHIALVRKLKDDFMTRKESEITRQESESRFDKVLDEMRRDREEQARKWDEEKAESARKWAEAKAESDRKWEESKAEADRKWEEQNKKWTESKAESDRKWEESRKEFDKVHEEIMAVSKKIDRSIGALGARWGMQSERTFRYALKSILEENFGVEVININEYDDTGEVFGRPDQVEIDIIIKNGTLIICELKSSLDKADMYIFERKVRFYEKRHQQKATRIMVISPMISEKALDVATKLGIEIFSDSMDVERL